jgi:2-haloacid dehalogenase
VTVQLSDFEALSFDCYGTLIDWEAGIIAVLRPWADAHGLDVDDDQLLEAFGRCESAAEEAQPGGLYPRILARTMTSIGAELGVDVTAEEADRLARSVPDWPAFPDSADALAALARRYQLIILSNVDRASFAGSNRRLGVTFDEVLTAQDIGSYKPSSRNFDALLTRCAELGIGDGRLLHVAQSLFHDHVPAKAVGLPTVWIDRRAGRGGGGATRRPAVDVQPDWVFSSMGEFAAACEPTA